MSTGSTVGVSIVALLLIGMLILALVIYEGEVKATDAANDAAAEKAAKSGGKGAPAPNTGGGGNGNGGTNSGGAPGNTSWTKGSGLDPYYEAQFGGVTFTPGKGFVMPVMNSTASPNAANVWNPKDVGSYPNAGVVAYNSITFDSLMSKIGSGSTLLYFDPWDGEHTWLNVYSVPFSALGVPTMLDNTSNNWSPYFMIADIPNALNLTWQKESNGSTSITSNTGIPDSTQKYFDIYSDHTVGATPGNEIIDSIDDVLALKKPVFIITLVISLEISPTETKIINVVVEEKDIPLFIDSPGSIMMNFFFNYHYSILPSDPAPSNGNPLFASMIYGANSYVDITYTRGYGNKIVNTNKIRYDITANSVFCIDYVTESSTYNPEYLRKTDNHVISINIPVPFFPKKFDSYLSAQIPLHPDVAFDMNAY